MSQTSNSSSRSNLQRLRLSFADIVEAITHVQQETGFDFQVTPHTLAWAIELDATNATRERENHIGGRGDRRRTVPLSGIQVPVHEVSLFIEIILDRSPVIAELVVYPAQHSMTPSSRTYPLQVTGVPAASELDEHGIRDVPQIAPIITSRPPPPYFPNSQPPEENDWDPDDLEPPTGEEPPDDFDSDIFEPPNDLDTGHKEAALPMQFTRSEARDIFDYPWRYRPCIINALTSTPMDQLINDEPNDEDYMWNLADQRQVLGGETLEEYLEH